MVTRHGSALPAFGAADDFSDAVNTLLSDALVDLGIAVARAGMQLIVRSAAQAEVRNGGRPASSVWIDVIQLQQAGGLTATTVFRNERATRAVSLVNRAPDRSGDVA
jgi:hypothetical protein